jgi:2-succinyl-5-enolpyruvyl-6-hydroxy-3-cyclohexene-1-carboxylate synthase
MGEVNDTFQNLTNVIQGDGEVIADLIRFNLEQQPHPFVQLWEELLEKVGMQAAAYEPDYSQMAAVKWFEKRQKTEIRSQYHYANSTAIRLANIYARHSVYCNRGVNGIEGSLSTAAGFSVVSEDMVYCIIGDLSFFYDQNALWNQNLHGNLRILLLNNGKGGIFNMLKGLEQSPSRDQYVAAEHHTSAEGICMQNRVVYLKATNMEEMQQGLDTLIDMESDRPVLLEVFTDATEDERVFKDYYRRLKI